MQDLLLYKAALEKSLVEESAVKEPRSLYDPINYILSLGGKRLRPILTLMSCDFFGTDFRKALPAALAVEWFHNFSLIHDDIMDEAPLRRGKKTVHHKWNVNTGILSGDAMLIMAYRHFEDYEPKTFQQLAKLFGRTAIEVCEGQQLDMDFETRMDVRLEEYISMIEYKTAVLVGASLQMGAIVAGADKKSQEHIYDFGRNLGIAFQLQDDYLDAFGDPETFGKQVGGDILSNKKTYLYLKAIELGNPKQKQTLKSLFSNASLDGTEKIVTVKEIMTATGAVSAIQKKIEHYTNDAFLHLTHLNIPEENKEKLRMFGEYLMSRNV